MPVRPLCPELAKLAKKELFEDSNELENNIQIFKTWVESQPHLKARTDEQWLVAFLRGCKFNLERAQKKIDLFYTLRISAADIAKRFPTTEEKFIQVLRTGACLILPKSNETLPRTIILKVGMMDPKKDTVKDLICVFYYLLQILLYEDDTTAIAGIKVIVDYKDFNMMHLWQLSIFAIKKIIQLLQDSLPLRIKSAEYINLPSSMKTIMILVKSLISEKISNRFIIHKDPKNILDCFDENIIPVEYGGKGGTRQEIIDSWVQKCEDYRDWLKEEEGFGVDESKRPSKPSIFGFKSGFTKLEID